MWKEKYEIHQKQKLGEGSFGQVFCASRKEDNLDICVKMIKKEKEFGEYIIESFCEHEIDIAQTLITNPHQNLVQIYDVYYDDIQDENAYIFMEKCDGNLTQFTKNTELSIKDELLDQLILDVSNGYCKLIQLNIIHRDIKPDNILYKQQNGKTIFKITDFGIGKILRDTTYMTQEIGTKHYTSPEMGGKSETTYDNLSDIFSFGIILFEMITGQFGENSLFKSTYKDKQQLQKTAFSEIYSSQLESVDRKNIELLDKMICYNQQHRITWQELKIWIEDQLKKKSNKQQNQHYQQQFYQSSQNSQNQQLSQKYSDQPSNKKRFEEYQINKTIRLSIGYFGMVCLAQRVADNLDICVKIIAKRHDFGEYNLDDFQQNQIDIAQTLITNPHQNLVQIYDVYCGDIQDENAYIFMEKCDGNLTQFTKNTELSIKDQLLDQLILDVSNGYCKLIQLNIIHRDIKPDHILYQQQNGKTTFKIAGFASGRIVLDSSYMTRRVGTPYYKAPEVDEEDTYNNTCDIFSFGIILFEIITDELRNSFLFKPVYKEKKQLENTKFSTIYSSQLQLGSIDKQYVQLLDRMICYDKNQRISWQELKIWIEDQIKMKQGIQQTQNQWSQKPQLPFFQYKQLPNFQFPQNQWNQNQQQFFPQNTFFRPQIQNQTFNYFSQNRQNSQQ